MKNFFYLVLAGLFMLSTSVCLANEAKVLKSLLIDEELEAKADAENAKSKAGDLLNKAPKKIEIKGIKQPAARKEQVKTAKSFDKYGEAPFGLAWGADNVYTKNTGVVLKDVSNEENPRMYEATFLPKPIKDFEKVNIYFGIDNMLWRVVGYGNLMEEDASASKVLQLYEKYSRLLGKKYGGKKEIYEPKTTTTEIVKDLGFGKTETITETQTSELGNKNFREELKSGESVLYSTFSDGKIGVVLSVEVNENNKSYIVIDYKNIQILQEQEDKMLESI